MKEGWLRIVWIARLSRVVVSKRLSSRRPGSGIDTALGIIGLVCAEGNAQEGNPVGQRRQHSIHPTVRDNQARTGFRLGLQRRL